MFGPALALGQNRQIRLNLPPGPGGAWPEIQGKIAQPEDHAFIQVTLLRQSVARARRRREVNLHASLPLPTFEQRCHRQEFPHAHRLQPYPPHARPSRRQNRHRSEALPESRTITPAPQHPPPVVGRGQHSEGQKEKPIEPEHVWAFTVKGFRADWEPDSLLALKPFHSRPQPYARLTFHSSLDIRHSSLSPCASSSLSSACCSRLPPPAAFSPLLPPR